MVRPDVAFTTGHAEDIYIAFLDPDFKAFLWLLTRVTYNELTGRSFPHSKHIGWWVGHAMFSDQAFKNILSVKHVVRHTGSESYH